MVGVEVPTTDASETEGEDEDDVGCRSCLLLLVSGLVGHLRLDRLRLFGSTSSHTARQSQCITLTDPALPTAACLAFDRIFHTIICSGAFIPI